MTAARALLDLPSIPRDTVKSICDASITETAHTNRERLLQLLRSRTQADPRWTLEELGAELQCTTRTVQRYLNWLRKHGRLALIP